VKPNGESAFAKIGYTETMDGGREGGGRLFTYAQKKRKKRRLESPREVLSMPSRIK